MRASTPSLRLCAAVIAWATVACSGLRTGPYETDASQTCGAMVGTCNVVTQTGCASTESCVLAADGQGGVMAACMASGNGAYGSACTASSGCASGLQCVGGQCRRACCLGNSATCAGGGAPVGSACTAAIQGGPAGLAVCTFACDWTTQNCPANQTCAPLAADGTADCAPAGSTPEGSTCMASSDCQSGLVCLGTSTSSTGTCVRICDPTAVSPHCTSAQTCTHVSTYPPTFGYCGS